MIYDTLAQFCAATAISTSATADAILGNVYDTGATPTLKSVAETPIYLVIQVTTALGGATSLRLRLVSDSTADLATSKTTHLDTGVIALSGNWAVGTVFALPLPPTQTYERYLGMWQNIVGTANAGAVNCFLTLNPPSWIALPNAI